jgi:hypothetical protein
MERGFEIKTLPYLSDLHTWLDHMEICEGCKIAGERIGTGELVPATDFCPDGVGIFVAFMDAVDHQHLMSLLN